MTSEQIEKLRFNGSSLQHADLLNRLIEERERLLDAAVKLAEQMCDTPGCVHRACAMEAYIRPDIDFAEAEHQPDRDLREPDGGWGLKP